MKKVTVIGSGNAFNTSGRAHACYLLETSGGDRLLMDLGATSLYRLQQMQVKLEKIRGLVLTHFHGDHVGGLPYLLLQMGLIEKRSRTFDIAGPPGVRDICERLLEVTYPALDMGLNLKYTEIPPHGSCDLGDFRIQALPIRHRPESVGYRVSGPTGKTFAFSGDTSFDENLFRLTRDTDLAIIELSMEAQTAPPTAHVSLEEVRVNHEKLGTRRLVFSHIYDDLAKKTAALNIGEIAHDGLELFL